MINVDFRVPAMQLMIPLSRAPTSSCRIIGFEK